MSGFDNATSIAVLKAVLGQATYPAPTLPLKLAVETTVGTATAAGTELPSTTRPNVTLTTPAGNPATCSNDTAVTVTAGSAGNVKGVSVYDSSATPKRIAWGLLGTARDVVTNDTLNFPIGSLTLTLTS